MALAANSITHRLDETAGYRPYFYLKGRDGVPAYLKHGSWDLGDMTGRFLESMVMARGMVGENQNWAECQTRLLDFLYSLFGSNDLIMDIDKDEPDHTFAQGSALYGLLALFRSTRDAGVEKQIQRLIDGLMEHIVPVEQHYIYPNVTTANGPCSHMAGYQIVPLMEFFGLTGYEPALVLSERLSEWAFEHDDTIRDDGSVIRIGWEGHLHAWMDTLSGIIQCSRVSKRLDKGRIVNRCKNMYDWVRSTEATAFGWVPDFPTSPTSETCAISSMMRLALELVEEGFPEYWNDLERFTRNQLVENQFRESEGLGITDQRVADVLRGSFDCWAEPNTLFASVRQWGKEDDADVEGCCVNGGMRGIFLASEKGVEGKGRTKRIHFLKDSECSDLRVESYLPREGRVVVTVTTEADLQVRVPDWADRRALEVTVGDKRIDPLVEGGYATIDDVPVNTAIEIRFPVRNLTETCKAGPKQYDITWLADTVMEVAPPGVKYPIYQRTDTKQSP